MPRKAYAPPAQVVECCHQGLADLSGCSQIVVEYLLPAYVIGLHECCAGSTQVAGLTEMAGWKFLAGDRAGRDFMTDVMLTEGGADGEVISTSDSGYACKIMRAIGGVDAAFQRAIGEPPPDYELRWLSVPSILVEGLWLHAVQHCHTSWVYPTLCLSRGMRDTPFFRLEELVGLASKLGKRREAFDDSPLY